MSAWRRVIGTSMLDPERIVPGHVRAGKTPAEAVREPASERQRPARVGRRARARGPAASRQRGRGEARHGRALRAARPGLRRAHARRARAGDAGPSGPGDRAPERDASEPAARRGAHDLRLGQRAAGRHLGPHGLRLLLARVADALVRIRDPEAPSPLQAPLRLSHLARRPSASAAVLIAGALLVAALLVRAYAIGRPPVDFQPERPYHSAIVARWYYIEHTHEGSAAHRQAALVSKKREFVREPPILEYAAALVYRATGGEHLWIPRLFLSICWVTGGLLLFLLARRLASIEAAVAALAFYLFLPFGINASRSFQPDPLMVVLAIAAVLLVVRDDAERSRR